MIRKVFAATLVAMMLATSLYAQDPTTTATLTSTTCPGSGCVSLTLLSNREVASVEVSGTWTGPLVAEISSSWKQVTVYDAGTKAPATNITANGVYLVLMDGTSSIRIRATSITGSAVVRLTAGQGSASFVLPVGAATESSLASLNAKVTAVNTGATVVSSSALPTGASTAAKQDTGNASLDKIARAVGDLGTNVFDQVVYVGAYNVDDAGSKVLYTTSSAPGATIPGLVVRNVPSGTQTVTASSLPLPTGASTSAKQDTTNTSLASIDTKTPSLGQAAMAASVPVAIASNQGAIPVTVGSVPSASGTISSTTCPGSGCVSLTGLQGYSSVAVEVGALAGTYTLLAERTVNGTDWRQTYFLSNGVLPSYYQTLTIVSGGNQVFSIDTAGYTGVRIRATAAPSSPVDITISAAIGNAPQVFTQLFDPGVGGLYVAAKESTLVSIDSSAATTASAIGGSAATIGDTPPPNALQIGGNRTDDPGVFAAVDVSNTTPTASAIGLVVRQLGPPVETVDDVPNGDRAMMMASYETTTGGTVRYVRSTNAAPGSSDIGIVVRNIPTGTQAISAASLPLPSGASTSALQTTGNTSLSNIDSKIPALGQALAAASTPVVLPAAQITTLTPPPAITGFALDATLTGGTQQTRITDGTNVASVKAASTAAVAADKAVVVALHPSSPLPAGSNTIGALSANQSVNQTQLNGVAVSVDRGVSDTGTQRIIIAQESTYAASTAAKTATAAGTAAFFEICGSASKTIRIQRVSVSGTVATAAIYGDIVLRKTSSAATGGTATTLTNVPYDSSSAAATATAKYFTVLPTGGSALVGTIFSQTLFFPVTATVANFQPQLVYLWRDQDAESPTLRGTAQCLTAAFGTTPTNAPTLAVSVAWTEK